MKSKKKTKKYIIGILAATILIITGGTFLYVTRPKDNSKIEVSEAKKTQAEQEDAEQAKSSDNKNSNQTQQPSQQSTAQPSKVGINITNALQQGGTLVINGLVSGATSGTCNLTLTNGSTKIQKSAAVGFQVSYYICQGYNIDVSEINPKGEWTATINLTSPNGSAQSEAREVNVQ
jgi:hypothetical protein